MQEQNAITHRIGQMQAKWVRKVTTDTKLVRWLIDHKEQKMIDAFTVIESSEQGVLEPFFFAFTQPFTDKDSYAAMLKEYWIATWNNPDYRKEVPSNRLPDWQSSAYENTSAKNKDLDFIRCMESFATAISKGAVLTLALLPSNARSLGKEWVNWVLSLTEILPSNLKLMVIDYKDHEVFKYIPSQAKEVTLVANLNMFGAMKEIATSSGDANEPGVGVNIAILNMLESLEKDNIQGVKRWGNEGVDIAQKNEIKNLEATVLVTYGSCFFQLKKYQDALEKFELAAAVSKQGIALKDTVCEALFIQATNFIAATYHIRGKKDKAVTYYLETAEAAKKYQNFSIYIEAMRQAAALRRKQYAYKESLAILYSCFNSLEAVAKDVLRYTTFYLVCSKLYDTLNDNNKPLEATHVADFAKSIWGENWQELKPEEMLQPVKEE